MIVDLPAPGTRPGAPPAPAPADRACGSCAAQGAARLQRLGQDIGGGDVVVALAGNPNTGKSTVFNALTGLRQHVGNWPGTTVSCRQGAFRYDDRVFKVIDLPGTYSLLSTSPDEEVARDVVVFGDPDVTVVVVDASRLERNLNLVLQVLEVTRPVVVALNLMDEARRRGVHVDVRHVARQLGVPVVPMSARRGEGIPELVRQVAATAVEAGPARRPRRGRRLDPAIEHAVEEIVRHLGHEFPGLPNARWVALRLLEGDRSIERAMLDGRLGRLAEERAAVGTSA